MTNFGTGAVDANGVRLYGEADAAGPYFSDSMNLGLVSVSALIGALKAKLVAQKTTTQSIANSVAVSGLTPVTAYDSTMVANSLSGLTFTPSTGKAVCTVAGIYKVRTSITFDNVIPSGTGYRVASIQKALAASPTTFTKVRTGQQTPSGATWDVQVMTESLVQLAVGDVVQIFAGQNGGAAGNLINVELDIRSAV